MLRVSAGHYRDVFACRVYDVFRDRTVEGVRIRNGWRYKLISNGTGGRWSQMYDSKVKAAAEARHAIATTGEAT